MNKNSPIKINNKVISKDYKKLISPLQKLIGLMFRSSVKKPLVFIFNKESKISLHMFFVFTTIDVIYLNGQKEIVELKENFLPFTAYFPKYKAQYIIEAEKGIIKKHQIKLQQKVQF